MIKRVLFPVLILAMALAGVTAPAGADTTDAAVRNRRDEYPIRR
jgi:hypothetical protein